MRQTLSNYDQSDDDFGLVGDAPVGAAEAPPRDRRLPVLLLTLCAMLLFAGGLYFAYVQGMRHSAGTSEKKDGMPLLRADEHPTKVRPEQPGGMAIPDQNVSLYNEKAGGPPVEKLLPAAEQPLPRPAPPPAAPTAKIEMPAQSPAEPTATPAPAATPAGPAAAGKPAVAEPPVKAAAAAVGGGVHLRLGSLRTPEAAREEWIRMKRENPDLLGQLTAVAVRTDLGEKGIYYRIQAGSFGDAAAAEKLCGELKRRNFGCLLAR